MGVVSRSSTMKQDVSPAIRRAVAAGPWDPDGTPREVLRSLVEHIGGSSADWDDGAGEGWGRVVVGGEVAAYLCMLAPLAIVVAGTSRDVLAALECREISVVHVRDMASEELCVDRAAVTALAGRDVSDNVDYSCMSAEELVWATL